MATCRYIFQADSSIDLRLLLSLLPFAAGRVALGGLIANTEFKRIHYLIITNIVLKQVFFHSFIFPSLLFSDAMAHHRRTSGHTRPQFHRNGDSFAQHPRAPRRVCPQSTRTGLLSSIPKVNSATSERLRQRAQPKVSTAPG